MTSQISSVQIADEVEATILAGIINPTDGIPITQAIHGPPPNAYSDSSAVWSVTPDLSLEALVHRFRIQEELALESEKAVEFLAKLHDIGVVRRADIRKRFSFNDVTGVALLATAGLCTVDPNSIRISPRGSALAHSLVAPGHDPT